MTALWSEQLPDRTAEDRKRLTRFALALLGGAALLGTVAGACFGAMVVAAEALHDGGDDA